MGCKNVNSREKNTIEMISTNVQMKYEYWQLWYLMDIEGFEYINKGADKKYILHFRQGKSSSLWIILN
jgi:hypothetical protein